MKKTEKITGVLVDVKAGVAREATIEKSLSGYYKALDCSCIDIVSRHIGGQGFDIVCDDEALLKDSPRPSALSEMIDGNGRQIMLYGSLFVVNYAGNGELCSLRQGQIKHIMRYVRKLVDRQTKETYPCLIDVEW